MTNDKYFQFELIGHWLMDSRECQAVLDDRLTFELSRNPPPAPPCEGGESYECQAQPGLLKRRLFLRKSGFGVIAGFVPLAAVKCNDFSPEWGDRQ